MSHKGQREPLGREESKPESASLPAGVSRMCVFPAPNSARLAGTVEFPHIYGYSGLFRLFTAIYTYSACFFFSSTRLHVAPCPYRFALCAPRYALCPVLAGPIPATPAAFAIGNRQSAIGNSPAPPVPIPRPFGSLAGRIPLRAGEDRSTLDHRPSASLAAICDQNFLFLKQSVHYSAISTPSARVLHDQ
jgi:hypothetical protein